MNSYSFRGPCGDRERETNSRPSPVPGLFSQRTTLNSCDLSIPDAPASADRKPERASRISVLLAPLAGFCPGVARAIRIALEARRDHPAARACLLGSIVHNAAVNRTIAAAGIEILSLPSQASALRPGDVAIVPAFGSPAGLAESLRAAGVAVSDATCPNVAAVFRRAEELGRAGATVFVCGDPAHEEVRSTCSRIEASGGRARLVRVPSEVVLPGPGPAAGPVGFLCQTTACPTTVQRIARVLRLAFPGRLFDFAKPCPATEARQAALRSVLRAGADLAIVVGGRDSRNTACLRALAARRVPAFHVESAADLLDARLIRHVLRGRVRVSRDWLPDRSVRVALTAGASTPDDAIAAVAERMRSLGEEGGSA